MSSAAPQGMRLIARVLACGALLFCMALIAASEADLLIWSAAAIVIAGLAYVPVRLKRQQALQIASSA
jgi:hypothetical protein